MLALYVSGILKSEEALAGFGSQPFDGALAIGKDVDDLEPPAVRQRLREPSELVKEGGLGSSAVGLTRALACLRHLQLLARPSIWPFFKSLIDYLNTKCGTPSCQGLPTPESPERGAFRPGGRRPIIRG